MNDNWSKTPPPVRVAYTINDDQPVICTYIGIDPLYDLEDDDEDPYIVR